MSATDEDEDGGQITRVDPHHRVRGLVREEAVMPKRTPSIVQLQNLTKGGSFDQGERVFFDGMTTDGNAVRITVPTDSMGLFIQQLQAFTALAQDDRGDRAPGESAPVSVMTVKGLGFHASADGTIVAIRVHMGKGIHVDVPLPIEQIDQIIASIQARAAEARKILKTTGH